MLGGAPICCQHTPVTRSSQRTSRNMLHCWAVHPVARGTDHKPVGAACRRPSSAQAAHPSSARAAQAGACPARMRPAAARHRAAVDPPCHRRAGQRGRHWTEGASLPCQRAPRLASSCRGVRPRREASRPCCSACAPPAPPDSAQPAAAPESRPPGPAACLQLQQSHQTGLVGTIFSVEAPIHTACTTHASQDRCGHQDRTFGNMHWAVHAGAEGGVRQRKPLCMAPCWPLSFWMSTLRMCWFSGRPSGSLLLVRISRSCCGVTCARGCCACTCACRWLLHQQKRSQKSLLD